MATPSTAPFPLTGDLAIDATTHGYSWQLDSGRTLRWAVAGGLDGEFWNNPQAVADQMSLIFGSLGSYANVRFDYAGAYANPVAAAPHSDITISLSASTGLFPSNSMWALAFFPDAAYNAAYEGGPGDVFLNARSQANSLASYAPGSAGYFLFLHEIGHALGLKHPHDSGGTGRPTFSQLGLTELDNDWFSVMSYEDEFGFDLGSYDPATPMPLDVLALQHLYGKNMGTNAADSSYTLPVNNFYSTIWDAGGNDTVDLSGASGGWSVSLPDMQLSTLVDTKTGMAYLESEKNASTPTTLYWLMGDIENVAGSGFTDTLVGSQGNNVLRGGGGNDAIDGAGGTDTALYASARDNYTIARAATGPALSVAANTGSEGTDSLTNIERLSFADRSVAFDGIGESVYRLYEAAFGRKPDDAGLGYWIAQRDAGLSLEEAARSFIASAEFQQQYGTNLDNAGFVGALYSNALNRAPDAAGFAYWTDQLERGTISRHAMLAAFSESPEHVAQLVGSLQNGVDYIQYA